MHNYFYLELAKENHIVSRPGYIYSHKIKEKLLVEGTDSFQYIALHSQS